MIFRAGYRLLIVFTLISLFSTLPLAARGRTEPSGAVDALTVTDYYGREVALEGPVMRVVSLTPGITETIFALGYGDRLAGRTDYCDYPPEASMVPSVGSLQEPNVEAVVALDPDLVIASTHFPEDVLDRLVKTGQTVAVLMGQESFEGVYDGVIMPLSYLLGDTGAGEKLIEAMETTRKNALSESAGFPYAPSVYYVVGFGEGGDWTAGGDTFIGEMIRMAGGRNIADDVEGWSFSVESIVERDPDLILIPAWAAGIFEVTPVYQDLRAVRDGHVYIIDENSIVRQGPRLADGLADLVRSIGSVF